MEVEVLRHDRGLAQSVPAQDRARAAAGLRVVCCDIPAGRWDVPVGHRTGTIGLLVLDGFLLRAVSLVGETSGELTGPRDVLRPWDDDTVDGPLPVTPSWTALTPARVALLDRDFVARAAEWPDLLVEVASRLIHRSRCQASLLAMSHLPRLEPRLLALLWHLADRFGQVEESGVAMPVRLTHETLGCMVGGRRPSVSRSMNRLAAGGLLTPRRAGGWWLHGEAVDAIESAGNPGYARNDRAETAGTASS